MSSLGNSLPPWGLGLASCPSTSPAPPPPRPRGTLVTRAVDQSEVPKFLLYLAVPLRGPGPRLLSLALCSSPVPPPPSARHARQLKLYTPPPRLSRKKPHARPRPLRRSGFCSLLPSTSPKPRKISRPEPWSPSDHVALYAFLIHGSRGVRLNQGQFCLPGDIHLTVSSDIFGCHPWERGCSWHLNILQCTGRPPPPRIIWPQISIACASTITSK